MGVLDGASSLSTPGLLLGTIASVGRAATSNKENEGGTAAGGSGTLERGKSSFSSGSTLERGKSPTGGSSLGGTLEMGAIGARNSLTGTLERKSSGLEKSNSFLNRTSLGNLGSPGLLNSLPRGAKGARDVISSSPPANTLDRRSSTLDRKSPTTTTLSPSATLDRRSSSAERGRSLIDEGQWVSLEKRGGSPSKDTVASRTEESQEREDYGDLTKARSFWKDLDSETVRRQSQDQGSSRRESRDYGGGSRRESKDFGGSRRESNDFGSIRRESKDFGSTRRESKDMGVSSKKESKDFGSMRSDRSLSQEPVPDYDMEVESSQQQERASRSKSKSSSVVKRQEPVAKRRRDSRSDNRPMSPAERAISPSVPWEERVRSRRGSSAGQDPDWNRGPAESTKLATLERKGKEERNLEGRAASLSRKGSNAATLAKRRESNPDESQHFLSLQLFTAHAEPGLDEYLPMAKQLEVESKHREEEDALYRKFIQERREQEDVVGRLEEAERDELFDQMNKMERSRIINLADKHCTNMLDLIHR